MGANNIHQHLRIDALFCPTLSLLLTDLSRNHNQPALHPHPPVHIVQGHSITESPWTHRRHPSSASLEQELLQEPPPRALQPLRQGQRLRLRPRQRPPHPQMPPQLQGNRRSVRRVPTTMKMRARPRPQQGVSRQLCAMLRNPREVPAGPRRLSTRIQRPSLKQRLALVAARPRRSHQRP